MPYASFNRLELRITKSDAASGSHQGACDDDIAALLERPYIKRQLDCLAPENIAAELQEYGAWDDVELADHAANRARILWIACGNIVEGG